MGGLITGGCKAGMGLHATGTTLWSGDGENLLHEK